MSFTPPFWIGGAVNDPPGRFPVRSGMKLNVLPESALNWEKAVQRKGLMKKLLNNAEQHLD